MASIPRGSAIVGGIVDIHASLQQTAGDATLKDNTMGV